VSTDAPIYTPLCRLYFHYLENRETVAKTTFLCAVGGILLTIGVLQVRRSRFVKSTANSIIVYLRQIAEKEGNTSGSSILGMGVRADRLKRQFIGDKMFGKELWRDVQEKLEEDCQIEKHWTRDNQGRAVEAYYFNLTGVVPVYKEVNTQNENSEHSISY